MPVRVCSICSAEPEIRAALETRFRAGGKTAQYRVMAKESGFSSTALHRHMRRHLPKSVLETSKLFQQGDSLYVWRPHETSAEEIRHINGLPPSVWIIELTYEAPMSPATIEARRLWLENTIKAKADESEEIAETETTAE